MNLFYGAVTVLYGIQTHYLEKRSGLDESTSPGISGAGEKIFGEAVSWWWIYFVAGFLVLTGYRRWRYGRGMTALIAEGESAVNRN